MDALASIARDSARFLEAVRAAAPGARVPACPEWVAPDLTYHLAEVQDFWSAVVGPAVGQGRDGDHVTPLTRPADDAALPMLAALATARLLAALAGRDPAESCWSPHGAGRTVGGVVRRQAHEALVHRVDAEQTAGLEVTGADAEVAADGIEEILRVVLDGVPAWGGFTPDGSTISVVVDGPGETPRSWELVLGRFAGTGPESGTAYDVDAAQLVDLPGSTTTQVFGPAWGLDLWLWGRSGREGLTVHGDPGVADRLRLVASQERR